MPAQPSFRPRPGGGFNQQIGGAFGEHLDEAAFSQSMQAKQQTQQATSTQSTQGLPQLGDQDGGAANDLMQQMMGGQQGLPGGAGQVGKGGKTGQGLPGQMGQAAPGQAKARPVGNVVQELVTRPVGDVAKGLTTLFDFGAALGVENPKDDPQKQAKRRQLHSRWQKLDQEQQEIAQKLYKQETERKQQILEEEERKKQEAARAQSEQPVQAPSGAKKGPVGPSGSKKKRAVNQLEQQRKTLSGPQSAN